MTRLLHVIAGVRVISLILLAMPVEALVLRLWLRRQGRPVPWWDIVGLLLPGACLLLAVLGAIGRSAPLVVAALTLALIAHIHDLGRRFHRDTGPVIRFRQSRWPLAGGLRRR